MIDSHCHLNFDNLSKDFSSIIKRAKENNITAILSINTNPDKFESHYQLIKKHQSLFISYGLHPENVNSFNIPSIKSLKFYCEYEQVIGIGETGLDFYRSTEHKSEQYQSFENHIECSYETNIYVDKQAPWNLKKTNIERMNTVLSVSIEIIRRATILLYPIMPESCNKILSLFNIDKKDITINNYQTIYSKPYIINEAFPVFPRVDIND